MAHLEGPLGAVSPLDGRYADKLEGLGDCVGEGGLIAYRLHVEAEWLLHLAEVPAVATHLRLAPAVVAALKELRPERALAHAAGVKAIERTTNHDVKAVEYLLRDLLTAAGAERAALAYLHFACTSEDINNLAYGLMLRDLRQRRLLPALDSVLTDLAGKAGQWAELGMMSRTHGQPASPTTVGKELAVFVRRLRRLRNQLAAVAIEGKINGAVGNYNAHYAAFPEVDWVAVGRDFVERRLGLACNPLTTQIECHDSLVECATILAQMSTVMIGLCRDVWGYISLGYFRQTVVKGEVGSSTMPHKVNPIDFENAEGNFGLCAALARHFAEKLPISRWQRDLTDSTVLRSLGTLAGYFELALTSLRRGLGKIQADEAALRADLDGAWEVLTEAVQTVMRRYGVVDAYERLKSLSRGQAVTREALHTLIDQCPELPASAQEALKRLTPGTYTGIAARLARMI